MRTDAVARQERKFLIGAQQRITSENNISRIMYEDSHNGSDGYMVRTLYFDTLGEKDYEEKMAGVETRRKIRLRIYDADSAYAFLEIKQKQGLNQLKRSLQIQRQEAISLMDGQYGCLLNHKEELATELYGIMMINTYRPKVVVEYKRKAFVHPENSIRITFDSQVRGTSLCNSFFDKEPHYQPVLKPTATVMEVKYNHFLLSYIKDMLQGCEKSEMAVSKYVLARQQQLMF